MGSVKRRGFTLLELLIVLVVISIGTALVAVKAMPQDQRLVLREAERLAQLLAIAQEQASLRAQTLAWIPNNQGFGFYEVFDDRLQTIDTDDTLRFHAWDVADLQFSVRIDGQIQPRILLSPEPGMRPVSIVLHKNDATVQLNRGLGGRFDIVSLPVGARP